MIQRLGHRKQIDTLFTCSAASESVKRYIILGAHHVVHWHMESGMPAALQSRLPAISLKRLRASGNAGSFFCHSFSVAASPNRMCLLGPGMLEVHTSESKGCDASLPQRRMEVEARHQPLLIAQEIALEIGIGPEQPVGSDHVQQREGVLLNRTVHVKGPPQRHVVSCVNGAARVRAVGLLSLSLGATNLP